MAGRSKIWHSAGSLQVAVLVVFGEFFDIQEGEFGSMGRSLFFQMLMFGGISAGLEGVGTAALDLSKSRQSTQTPATSCLRRIPKVHSHNLLCIRLCLCMLGTI